MRINDYLNNVVHKCTVLTIITLNFINKNESYMIKFDKSRSMNDGVETVLKKYLSSFKKMSADFPNHNLELQLEIIEPVNNPRVVPLRRMFPSYKLPKMRRSDNENNQNNLESKKAIQTTTAIYTTIFNTRTATETTTFATTPHPIDTTAVRLIPQEKPLYREDLQRALHEFEKKISNTHTTTGCTGMHQMRTVPEYSYSKLPSPTYILNRNIESIVELLKRGVHVENHVDRPSDENLEWLQIKIPKNI